MEIPVPIKRFKLKIDEDDFDPINMNRDHMEKKYLSVTKESAGRRNICLINPRVENRSQNKAVQAIMNLTFPTSLGILSSYIMKFGMYNFDIIDEQIDVFDLESDDIKKYVDSMVAPKIVGFSVLTLNVGRATEIAAKVKEADPEVTVVFGGIPPTVADSDCLKHDCVDVCVRGEGERSFKLLCQHILAGEDYSHIDGLSVKVDGKVVQNPATPLLKDLDQVPAFPYFLFEKDKDLYPDFSALFTSRGCPYKCTFCSSRDITGLTYRFNSAERTLEEIEILVERYGQKSIHLMDDNIGVNKKQFFKLCQAIKDKGWAEKVAFEGSMRGDDATYKVLRAAKEAGFRMVYYGLETGSERLMKDLKKGETVQEIIDAIYRAKEVGIMVGTTIIFGLPDELHQDRLDCIKLLKNVPLDSVRYNTLAPYPGTPLYNVFMPRGQVKVKGNWENFGVQYMWESDDIPYVPETSDRLELIHDTMTANLAAYISWEGIKNMIFSPTHGGNVIKLSEKWYTSFTDLWKLFNLGKFLILRYLSVKVRYWIRRLTGRLEGKPLVINERQVN